MHQSFNIDLLDFVLRHNFFVFDGCSFKQVSGTAMGACCAPSYAILFLGWLEEAHVYTMELFNEFVINWSCYIDDIMFIWTGPREECLKCISILNATPTTFISLLIYPIRQLTFLIYNSPHRTTLL